MIEYVQKVIKPYVTSQRQSLQQPDQMALCICDVFAAHRLPVLKEELAKMNISLLYVPAGCTGIYSLTVNIKCQSTYKYSSPLFILLQVNYNLWTCLQI